MIQISRRFPSQQRCLVGIAGGLLSLRSVAIVTLLVVLNCLGLSTTGLNRSLGSLL
jgi:hypothetical protein